MIKATMLRRIRCGNIEAIVTSVALPEGQARYGVFFQRSPQADSAANSPFFDFGDLLTISKLARLAHSTLQTVIADEG